MRGRRPHGALAYGVIVNQRPDPDRFDPVPDARPNDEPWPHMIWPVPAGTELTGTFVRLSAVDPAADSAELFDALDHDGVWAHVPGRPGNPAHLQELLRTWQTTPGWHPWVVRTRRAVAGLPADAIVGTSSYEDVSAHDARLEVGYTLYTPAVWATAVNPEAKLLLFGCAFDTLGAGRVQLKTDTRNQRAQRAIARLGARYEGTLQRHMRRADGTVRDTVMFAVTADEWPLVRERLTARLQA